jgi:hypothetical protein
MVANADYSRLTAFEPLDEQKPKSKCFQLTGGEEGIRTLDTALDRITV